MLNPTALAICAALQLCVEQQLCLCKTTTVQHHQLLSPQQHNTRMTARGVKDRQDDWWLRVAPAWGEYLSV